MKRYFHKLDSTHDTTMEIGQLIPIQCQDVLAGQHTYLNTSAIVRFQPMVSPAFEKMNMHIVHFFVPYRLLWDDWFDFISGQRKIEIPTTYLKLTDILGFSQISFEGDFRGGLLDYLNVLGQAPKSFPFESHFPFFPFLAYHKIWSDHFRNEQIQDEVDIEELFNLYLEGLDLPKLNSLDEFNSRNKKLFGLRRVNWGKDRFTSALLETEADPQISLPVGSDGEPFRLMDNLKRTVDLQVANDIGYVSNTASVTAYESLKYGGTGLAGVDLSDFKLASAIWNFQINQNKYGRDIEAYFKKYGLKNMDLRLKKSEVIGGFAESIRVSDIIATSSDDLGKQGGHALGMMKPKRFKHYAPEHGMILSLAYIRPKATYYGGADRFYHKRDMLDFYQAEFSNIGYQPVYKTEIGSTSNGTMGIPLNEDDMAIFGYEQRYNEYRSCSSQVSGALAPNGNMSTWANPRNFTTAPNLNSEFLECNPSNQIWAFPNEPKAIVHFERKVSSRNFVPNSANPYLKVN